MFELGFEFADIFEVAVDAGEADVGDGVQVFEARHDELADLAGGAFALGRVDDEGFGFIDDGLHLGGGDIAFLAGLEQAVEDLLAVETLAAAVFLDDHVGDLVDALVGGKAFFAALALAPPPDGIGFLALARVDDAILTETAVGALHWSELILAVVGVGGGWPTMQKLSFLHGLQGHSRWLWLIAEGVSGILEP